MIEFNFWSFLFFFLVALIMSRKKRILFNHRVMEERIFSRHNGKESSSTMGSWCIFLEVYKIGVFLLSLKIWAFIKVCLIHNFVCLSVGVSILFLDDFFGATGMSKKPSSNRTFKYQLFFLFEKVETVVSYYSSRYYKSKYIGSLFKLLALALSLSNSTLLC